LSDAAPVKEPTKVVEVTLVSPAIVVTVEPRLTAVDPIVIELLVNAPFGILVKLVPVKVGVLVQDGEVPDMRTWLLVPADKNVVVLAAV